MLNRNTLSILLLSLWALVACQGYDVKINDKVVYSPPALLSDFPIEDSALRTCLEQAVIDASITDLEQLTALNCSHAGIASLSGLGEFYNLQLLKLDSNNIQNLVELSRLTALQAIDLSNNRVVDPAPLYSLGVLAEVKLEGNASLQCPKPDGFNERVVVTVPEHCR